MLALAVIPAVWHVVDFEEDIDPEFPKVVRPTFNVVPPAAYRLAEPGDTLDRIQLYLAAASVVLASGGVILTRGDGLWPAALALSVAGLWYKAQPRARPSERLARPSVGGRCPTTTPLLLRAAASWPPRSDSPVSSP